MTADIARMAGPAEGRRRIDRLGVLAAAMVLGGLALPFAILRANRIAVGDPLFLVQSLPSPLGAVLAAAIVAAAVPVVLRSSLRLRLAATLSALVALLVAIGLAAHHLTPSSNAYARVSFGGGFWLLLAGFALALADTLARLRIGPLQRLALLLLAGCGLAAMLGSGLWRDLAVLREYASRADIFWVEAGNHIMLAFASLAAAILVGIPLGVLCHRSATIRQPLLNVLNIVQTIPSIALFGLLIAPLAWLAASLPLAAKLGVSGIGAAPALVALFLYSLLPIVANTLAGLEGVPAAARDAALGMGMTARQTLLQVEAPLAFPVILAGIRIVLVQNIGLATIAALIGGGGFGVFVFQGMGQTAIDLILLGALPTVLLSFAAAVAVDAAIDLVGRRGAEKAGAT